MGLFCVKVLHIFACLLFVGPLSAVIVVAYSPSQKCQKSFFEKRPKVKKNKKNPSFRDAHDLFFSE
jgi:hypothetical protein